MRVGGGSGFDGVFRVLRVRVRVAGRRDGGRVGGDGRWVGGDGRWRGWNWVCSVVGRFCGLASLRLALALLGQPLLGLCAEVGEGAVECAAGGGFVTLHALHGGLVVGSEETGQGWRDGLALECGGDEHGDPLFDAAEFPGGVGGLVEEEVVDCAFGVEALAELVTEQVPLGGVFSG